MTAQQVRACLVLGPGLSLLLPPFPTVIRRKEHNCVGDGGKGHGQGQGRDADVRIPRKVTKNPSRYRRSYSRNISVVRSIKHLAAISIFEPRELPVMRIIEHQDPRTFGIRRSALFCREIIQAARDEAQHIREQHSRRLAESEKKALEAGFQAGLVKAAQQLLSAQSLKEQLFCSARHRLAEIVRSVAEQVIGSALQEQPESILERIIRALRHTLNAQCVAIVVSPADRHLVQQSLLELRQHHPQARRLTIIEDSSLPPGDARLETELGVVESSVQKHLQTVLNWVAQTAALCPAAEEHQSETQQAALPAKIVGQSP